jgi:hypothetical protein
VTNLECGCAGPCTGFCTPSADALSRLRDENAALKEALAAHEETKRLLRWYRAAHMLVAQEEAFLRVEGKDIFTYTALDVTANGSPRLCILCSDTFGYACADAEDADYADAEQLLQLAIDEGWPGLYRWILSRRHARGEPVAFVAPVAQQIKRFDDLLADIKRVTKERDEARAAVEAGLVCQRVDQAAHEETQRALTALLREVKTEGVPMITSRWADYPPANPWVCDFCSASHPDAQRIQHDAKCLWGRIDAVLASGNAGRTTEEAGAIVELLEACRDAFLALPDGLGESMPAKLTPMLHKLKKVK